jgi:hypothetical protein
MKKICNIKIEEDAEVSNCFQIVSQVIGFNPIIEDSGIMSITEANKVIERIAKEIKHNNPDIEVNYEKMFD